MIERLNQRDTSAYDEYLKPANIDTTRRPGSHFGWTGSIGPFAASSGDHLL